jgi:MoxR-like ATPase
MNIEKTMNQEFMDKLQTMSKREQSYFRIMWGKSGVLYITAKPGVAKSAIARSIAQKMGFRYMDIRLSMVDETDVGLYPNVSDVDGVKCLDFVVPRWAIEANKQPTIIHFEELNRASQSVRNAALQILLERQIGVNFKFNETVLMMSSGNLGDEDGTDVEEFDSALNNRLIHVKHSLSFQEWVDGFAKENVQRMIVSYLQSHP